MPANTLIYAIIRCVVKEKPLFKISELTLYISYLFAGRQVDISTIRSTNLSFLFSKAHLKN